MTVRLRIAGFGMMCRLPVSLVVCGTNARPFDHP